MPHTFIDSRRATCPLYLPCKSYWATRNDCRVALSNLVENPLNPAVDTEARKPSAFTNTSANKGMTKNEERSFEQETYMRLPALNAAASMSSHSLMSALIKTLLRKGLLSEMIGKLKIIDELLSAHPAMAARDLEGISSTPKFSRSCHANRLRNHLHNVGVTQSTKGMAVKLIFISLITTCLHPGLSCTLHQMTNG